MIGLLEVLEPDFARIFTADLPAPAGLVVDDSGILKGNADLQLPDALREGGAT